MFSIRGFKPLIAIVFLNSFIDLGHKTVLQNTIFKVYSSHSQVGFFAVVHILLILPYILAFTPSGFLADRFGKHRITQWAMASTIPLSILTWMSYANGWFSMGLGLLFLFSLQATFYAPARNGYLKGLVGDHQLPKGNAYLQTAMVGSILTSALLYSVAFEYWVNPLAKDLGNVLQSVHWIGAGLLGLSILQTALSLLLPHHIPGSLVPFKWRDYVSGVYLRDTIGKLVAKKRVFRSSLALGCMLGVNQMLLSLVGSHLKGVANVTNTIVTQGLLAIAGVGMVGGALLASRLSVGFIELGVLPVAMGGAFLGLWWLADSHSLLGIATCMALFGVSSGLFIIPLTAMIQQNCSTQDIGKLSAADGFIQNVLMGIWLLATIGLSWAGVSSFYFLGGLSVLLGLSTFAAIGMQRYYVIRLLLRLILKVGFKLSASGYQEVPLSGPYLIVCQRISWVALMGIVATFPRRIRKIDANRELGVGERLLCWCLGIGVNHSGGVDHGVLVVDRVVVFDGVQLCPDWRGDGGRVYSICWKRG